MTFKTLLTNGLRTLVSKNGITYSLTKQSFVDVTANKQGGAVLMYHTVGEKYPKREALPKTMFRKHLNFLTTNYELVDFRQLLNPESDPSNCVALTFDGGYADFYSVILPLLREFDVPATVFVVPERIGQINGQPEGATKWVNWFDFMTHEQISELIDDPLVQIGNKTLTHDHPLPELTDDELDHEIVQGKQSLEREYSINIDSFCYPRGQYDKRAVKLVRDHHEYAVITRPDFVNSTTDNTLIPRFTADWKTKTDLRKMLTDTYVLEQNFRRIIS
jgi:peptidoglycan/xylan/chitin deacetylase (PgdA/CDA1 family)